MQLWSEFIDTVIFFELCLWLDTNVKGDIDMAFLNENEWIRLNEIAYNISFIYTVEEMQHEILNRWLPFLISYDSAIFARISTAENGSYQFQAPAAFHLPQQAVDVWMQESLNSDAFRWALYTCKGGAFRESMASSDEQVNSSGIYQNFYLPNHLAYSVGLSISFREEPVGLLKLYRQADKPPFSERDMFVLEQLHKHFAYRLVYEAKKGDTRYFYAKGYHEKLCSQYGLTSREGEMLDLAVHGLSNEDIAQKMNISIHTVKKHFHSIYTKMNVRNRIQMIQSLPVSTNKIDFDAL